MNTESSSAGSDRRRRRFHPAGWLLLVLLVAEFVLFDAFGSRRHTGVYPRWNDQVQYLGEAYTGYEYARAHGYARGLGQTLVNPSAQGTLHDFAAVIVFAFAGPSRSAALALNMLALMAWQGALFLVVARRTRSRWLALAVAMLPLALRGPWENGPGSAYDFRLDHLAMCALGIASAAAVLANGFRSRRGAVAFGLAVGGTLLTRFLTGTYFVVIFAGALGWILSGADRRLRLFNLAIAALVAGAVAAPFFWLNREWVWNYYYIGHYVGPESAIRDPHLGLVASLEFVDGALRHGHVGAFFGVVAVLGAIALAFAARGRGRRELDRTGSPPLQSPGFLQEQTEPTERLSSSLLAPLPSVEGSGCGLEPRVASGESKTTVSSPSPPRRFREAGIAITGALFFLAPALVLTLHRQKSEVVVNALVPGLVLLVAAAWAGLGREPRRTRALPVAVAVIALGCFVFFAQRQLRPAYDAAALATFRQINALADYVFDRTRAAKIEQANIAVDNITDCLDGQVLRVICYERHRVWMPFGMSLPISIAEPTTAEVMQRLAESDFVFLGDDDAPVGPWPYDRKLAALRPQLRSWCDEHLQRVLEFSLWGRHGVLYERRGLLRRQE